MKRPGSELSNLRVVTTGGDDEQPASRFGRCKEALMLMSLGRCKDAFYFVVYWERVRRHQLCCFGKV